MVTLAWGDYDNRKDNGLLSILSSTAPRIPWDKFVKNEFRWVPGEHIGLIGPTGQGKTTLMNALLPLRKYVVVFGTKPRDDTMMSLAKQGYVIMREWKSIPVTESPRRLLWPDAKQIDSRAKQQEVFGDAFGKIFREGGWTIAIDELWYFNNILKFGEEIKLFLLQARSLHISLVLATQRPAWIPLEVYDQSTHLFFWRDNDETNLNRLSGISYRSAGIIRAIVSDLEQHQVLYINTRTGKMLRTRAPKPTE